MSQNPTQVPGTAGYSQVSAGRFLKTVPCIGPQAASAGGAVVASDAVNRTDPQVYLSARPVIPASITLASGQDATVERIVEHRADSADSWLPLVPQADDLVIEALDSGAAQKVDLGEGWNIDLSGAKSEVRISYEATLSASGADRVTAGGAVLVLLAGSTNPQS
jgi:hypothetical protein